MIELQTFPNLSQNASYSSLSQFNPLWNHEPLHRRLFNFALQIVPD